MVFDFKKQCIAVGYHSGYLKEMAHLLKEGNIEAITKASNLIAKLIPDNSIIVPMPGHEGYATYTYIMANLISKRTGCRVIEAIQGFSRESAYEAKLKHKKLDIWFFKADDVPSTNKIVFIDNVVASGATSLAARRALGNRGITISLTLAPR